VPVARDFFLEIDRGLSGLTEKLRLRVIGSTALMLQTDYERGTTDGDVLATAELAEGARQRLTSFAGKGTPFHRRRRMYLDLVSSGIPFLPHAPRYHVLEELDAELQHLELHVLDLVDVCVSKLKPFRPRDEDDIREMVNRKLLPHDQLVARFREAVDDYSGADMESLPRFIANCTGSNAISWTCPRRRSSCRSGRSAKSASAILERPVRAR